LFHDGRLRGLWGFDATGAHPGWTRAVADALVLCGSLVSQARFGAAAPAKPAPAASALAPVVYLRIGSGVRSVALDDILGVQSNGDYVLLHLADGTTLLDLRPLKLWESLLPFARFMRVHRTAIVAVRRVQALERRASGRWQLRLAGVREPWRVSRERIAELRSRLGY
jgi:DNA-binding LytR/AlgR family response regulator